jgi:hypothetical protein
MHYEIDAPQALPEQLQALQTKTEQYCVVLQTLMSPPPIQIVWGVATCSKSNQDPPDPTG